MKNPLLRAVVVAVVTIVAGCSLYAPSPTHTPMGGSSLPADQVSDITRAYAGDFRYETVLPVALNLRLALYEPDTSFRSVRSLPIRESGIVVELRDARGGLAYAGHVQPDGTLSASLRLPAAPENMTLTLSAAGFETRQIVIRDMVRYSEIKRTVGLLSEGEGRAATSLLSDRDGDLVPDVYDAFPDDPARAFVYNSPADGKFTIAFEDLFGQALAGDADYNDFIAKYWVQETANADNAITEIKIDAEASTKLANYDHKFGIRLDSFKGSATISGTYIDQGGATQSFGSTVQTAPANIPLFLNSRYAVGKPVSFTVQFDTPQSMDSAASDTDRPPYNPYLIVLDTGNEIHLMGEQDLTGSSAQSYQDAQGFPWALLVPTDWVHPDERQRIEVHYPRFTLWRQSFGTKHTDWYLFYDTPYVPTLHVYAAGYYTGSSNDVAVSWKDGQAGQTDLHATSDARAQSVFGHAGDAYVAGFYTNSDGKNAAGYWKNGVLTPLYSDAVKSARASSIYVDATGVYVAGYYNDGIPKACYWKDGVRTDLYTAAASEATGICVSGGNVYVAGYYNNGTNDASCYWVNGASGRTDLYTTAYSRAKSIHVASGNVYVAGAYLAGALNACYWTNTSAQRTDLGSPASAESVMGSGPDVYVAGFWFNGTNLASCTWRNGARTDLYNDSTPGNSAAAYSIFVQGGDVYASGYTHSGSLNAACYWKNGTRIDLYTAGNSAALSIQAAE